MLTSVCRVCGIELNSENWHLRFQTEGHRNYICKACNQVYYQQYHIKNRERDNRRNSKWHDDHPERAKTLNHAWYEKNRKQHNERSRKWRKDNPERAWVVWEEWYDKNKTAKLAYSHKHYVAHADIKKNQTYQRKFGITTDDKRAMWERQGRRCYLCKRPLTFEESRVDHNHETGELRGAAHNKCNVLLGMCKEDIALLQNIIDELYIMKISPSRWPYKYRSGISRNPHLANNFRLLLWNAQDGLCYLCKFPLPAKTSQCCVDHDPKSGCARGLVHKNCNSIIGIVCEDPQLLQTILDSFRTTIKVTTSA